MLERSVNGLRYYQFSSLADTRVVQGVFTRLGGVSAGPIPQLNVGLLVGDDPHAVEENLGRIYHALSIAPERVVTVQQVHGNRVAVVGEQEWGTVLPATDGLITARAGTTLLLRFADCLPLLLYAPRQNAIALVHSGWRGTVDGIAVNAVRAMQAKFCCAPHEMRAALGPTIGPCCYEVGPDLCARVKQGFGQAADELLWRQGGRLYFDLPGAVRYQLQQQGVMHIESSGVCTSCSTAEFYSHRAEKGRTGRFAVVIGLHP